MGEQSQDQSAKVHANTNMYLAEVNKAGKEGRWLLLLLLFLLPDKILPPMRTYQRSPVTLRCANVPTPCSFAIAVDPVSGLLASLHCSFGNIPHSEGSKRS